MSDHEGIQLRFYLVAQLMDMPYGWNRRLDGRKVRRAWAPTGDHDRSFEAAFRAMALASGGHRPEESYTTDERITNDLDGSFKWHEDPASGDYVFHRRDDACPKCRGRLSVGKREAIRLADISPSEVMPTAMAFTESWTPCDMHGADREAE